MHYAITTKELEASNKKRNIFVSFLALSMSVNILQGVERLFSSEKIVILPPDIQKEIWIRGAEVSDSYIEEWAYYLSSLLLTASPSTIDYQTDLVLRHVSPEAYAVLKRQLKQDAAHLKKNNAGSVFQPKDVVIHKKTMTAKVTGSLSSLIGKEKVLEKQHTYEMAFTMTKGKFLQLTRFEKLNKEQKDTEGDTDDLSNAVLSNTKA